jgi:hypothetical protein
MRIHGTFTVCARYAAQSASAPMDDDNVICARVVRTPVVVVAVRWQRKQIFSGIPLFVVTDGRFRNTRARRASLAVLVGHTCVRRQCTRRLTATGCGDSGLRPLA